MSWARLPRAKKWVETFDPDGCTNAVGMADVLERAVELR